MVTTVTQADHIAAIRAACTTIPRDDHSAPIALLDTKVSRMIPSGSKSLHAAVERILFEPRASLMKQLFPMEGGTIPFGLESSGIG